MTLTREEHGKAREGRLTGSLVQRLMAGGPKAWNTVAREMRNPKKFYSLEDAPGMPDALAWGQRTEPQAAAMFWDKHPEFELEDPKFVPYQADDSSLFKQYLAVSPDRLVLRGGERIGGLETKCPYDGEVHVKTVQAGGLPEWCRWQVYHGMLVCNVPQWWFVCWDPRATDPAWRYYEFHVVQDARFMRVLRERLTTFLEGFTAGIDFTEQQPQDMAARYSKMF